MPTDLPDVDTDAEEPNGDIGITMSPKLAMEVLTDQAGSFEHAVRESYQNGIDSENSTEVRGQIDGDGMVVHDNGDGMDLTEQKMQEFLAELGKSSKERDDDKTIGQFGIGLGQVLAFGRTEIRTRDSRVIFDVQNWGLQGDLSHGHEHVEGFEVRVDWYEDKIPEHGSPQWQEHMDSLRGRFQYVELTLGTEVYLNDERISDGEFREELNGSYVHTEETEHAWISVKHSVDSEVSIYSNGLYVKEHKEPGLEGVVVSKGNLDLDFSRNDIKSGCELWGSIQDELEEIKKKVLTEVPDNNLNSSSRKAIAQFIASGDEDEWADRPVFKKANNQTATWEEVKEASEIGYSSPDDKEADVLVERGHMVLNTHDSATRTVKRHNREQMPASFDVASRAEAEGLIVRDEIIEPSPDALRKKQLMQVCFARLVADKIGCNRRIVWGESNKNRAWTDGRSYIALTDSAIRTTRRDVWIHELYRILIHEWAHDRDSSETARHGENYALDYRRKMEKHEQIFYEIAEDVSRNGVGNVLKKHGYHPKQVFTSYH